jgi:hypothetical protein
MLHIALMVGLLVGPDASMGDRLLAATDCPGRLTAWLHAVVP